MDTEKPPSLRSHITRILYGLIAALLLYVLGIGPACWLAFRYERADPVFEKLYGPLVQAVRVTPLERPLISYMLWWQPGFGSTSYPEVKSVRARADIDTLGTALKMYGAEVYDFPTTEQGLQALIEKPVIEPIPRKWEQQMEAPILDPWGRPYVYRYRGWWNRSDEQYELFSLGEDGVESADDIGEKHPK